MLNTPAQKAGAIGGGVVAAGIVAKLLLTSAPLVTVPLHNAPQGVTSCTIPAAVMLHTIGVLDPNGVQYCPFLEPQSHWKPGDGSPAVDPPDTLVHDLSHGHFGCNFPELGELSGPITVPCRIMLFHTAGEIADGGEGLVAGDLLTNVTFDDATVGDGPLVGDPNGLKSWTFHMTITPKVMWPPADGITTPVPPHGVFVWHAGYRIFFDTGDTNDVLPEFANYATFDPTQPEAPLPEIGMALGTKNIAVSARDTESGTWGQNVVEVRDQCLPLWAPFSSPIACPVFAYTYSPEPLAAQYQILLDPDFHNGVPGTPLVFRTLPSIVGAPVNLDYLDPLVISKSTPPAGYPLDGTHKLCEVWQESSDPTNPTPGVHGGSIAPGQTSITLLCHDVKIGSNPVGCTPATCPANPTPPAPTPPPIPPPTPPPTPPPAQSCTGTVSGTSTDGKTITVTSGTVVCS